MAACQYRPEPECWLTPCARRVVVDGVVEERVCVCAGEVRDEVKAAAPEVRVARVPDSAREGAA